MAGKIESLREYIGEFDSDEIFPCKDCINKCVEIESDGLCTDCRIFLCKECIKSHKQGDRGSHIVINIESGCAYLGDYSRRQLGEIWVPDDSETIASATGDAYDFLELESTDNWDINYKESDESSTIDEWLSLDDEESFTQDFLEEKEPAEEKTSDLSELPFFSRLGRNSQKPNRIGFWSIEDSIHESEDDPQLDTDDEIRNFKFIADATIPIKVNSNVSSVAMLTEDTLVIVDNGINYVIVLQVLQDTVIIKGTIVFNDIPFGVARTCNNEFVVTFPDQHAVRFVDFEGNDFHVGHAREVHGVCFGIGMLENNMVIAYPASGLIRILTKEGFVLKTIKTDPINLSFWNGHIAVYEKKHFHSWSITEMFLQMWPT